MAKVQLPLLSGSATGQFGKAIAYYRCKNIQTGRKYTIPTRPNTPAQKAQTALFRLAVEAYHQWDHSPADLIAFSRLTNVLYPKPPGYNTWLSCWMESYKKGNAWTFLGHFERLWPPPAPFIFTIKGPVDTPIPTLHWGRIPSALTDSRAMIPGAPGVWSCPVSGISPAAYYFFQVKAGTPWVNYGYTGVYEFFNWFAF